MEHKKSGIENMKVLVGDFLDELNLSHSELLRRVDELEGKVSAWRETAEQYETKLRELEQLIAELKQPAPAPGAEWREMVPAAKDAVREEEPDGILTGNEPDGITESNEPVPDHDPGFSLELEEEEIIPAVAEKPVVIEPVRTFEPKPEPVSQPVGKELKAADASAGDLFSQPEVHSEPGKEFEQRIILETVRPDWYDWEVDYPAPYIENIAEGIGFNDRILFLKELFEGDEQLFRSAVIRVNEMKTFQEAVQYLRGEFPRWNDQSDEVYRFYMNIRRKLRK